LDEKEIRWLIRAMSEKDLSAVTEIERASFSSPWSERAFVEEFDNPLSHFWILVRADRAGSEGVVGYICVWVFHDEIHVMNLATHPSHRRKGVARRLLNHAMAHSSRQGALNVVLEVRTSNHAAQQLYRAFGFRVVGRRSNYYKDTGEDALVMMKSGNR
jgi:ribosomal-protein-alanine N-acetyltransferase